MKDKVILMTKGFRAGFTEKPSPQVNELTAVLAIIIGAIAALLILK